MANLDIPSLELTSSARPVPANGSPGSLDFNAFQNGVVADLANIAELLNEQVLPVLAGLASQATDGVDGTSIWGNQKASSSDHIFRDSSGNPYSLSDLISRLYAAQGSLAQAGNDLSAQLLAVQTRLATTQQNDLRASVQSLQDSINIILPQLTSALATIATQGAAIAKRRTVLLPVSTSDSAPHQVTVTFNPAFPDGNFLAEVSVESADGLILTSWKKMPDYTLQVTVQSGAGGASGNLHVLAQYLG
jgi:hypothetical protein